MTDLEQTDGMLREWGTRLFYPPPKKAKRAEDGKAFMWITLSAATVREKVRQAVAPGAKQVMVKITGGGRGMLPLAAHMRYISRQGKPEVGGRGQTLELEDERGDKLSGAQAMKDLAQDWRMAGSYIPDTSSRREAFNIILSMPGGTPADAVRDAARDFAQETFAGHKYVFVLHEDTDAPHVHLAVRAERSDGVRLNPRKADLQRWRERFAARLRDRGIDAVATRAPTRGVTRASRDLWRTHAGPKGRERKPRPQHRTGVTAERSQRAALGAWEQIAGALARSSDERDRDLAHEVAGYVGKSFGRSVSNLGRRAEGGSTSRTPSTNRQAQDPDIDR
jgi:Relaxase/Mobilisation nuclease domain